MKIYITDDFDPDKIIDSGQCFRPKRLDDGRYRFITGRNVLHIFLLSSGTWQADCTPYAWKHIWYPYFDLETDYKKLRAKIPKNDLFLKKAAAYGSGIRILQQNPFEMLITFIISQRKSIPAIRSAVEKLCRIAGTPVRTETEDLYLFPSPSRLSRLSLETLHDCSLGYRAPYVRQAARMVAGGKIKMKELSRLSDQDLLEQLQTIPGVGIKVASCVSLYGFHRTATAPVDVWIDRVISAHYNKKNPFPDFKKTAGLMQQYMFYYYRDHAGK